MNFFTVFKRQVKLSAFRSMAALGLVKPLAWWIAQQTIEVPSANAPTGTTKKTLLALNPIRFRGDLQILAASGRFRVLEAPFNWQGRFLATFYPAPKKSVAWIVSKEASQFRDHLRSFFRKFLPAYYSILKIDAVLTANHLYAQDYDWSAVSHQLGMPTILLYRENLSAHKDRFDQYYRELSWVPKFLGTHALVHNEVVRDLWISSGFLDASQVSAIGAPRMDQFIGRVNQMQSSSAVPKKPQVLLFSFGPAIWLHSVRAGQGTQWSDTPGFGFEQLCFRTHQIVADFARKNPQVQVVIKPKWGGAWIEKVKEILMAGGLNADQIPNLIIDATLNPHDLIMDSSVVISYGSTTLLESALAGKVTIVPDFAEATRDEFKDFVCLRGEYQLFDVASSPEHLFELIETGVHNPGRSKHLQVDRRRAFERHISSVDGAATPRLVQSILNIIAGQTEQKH